MLMLNILWDFLIFLSMSSINPNITHFYKTWGHSDQTINEGDGAPEQNKALSQTFSMFLNLKNN